MKSMATFAIVALFCVPANAQMGGMGGAPATQARSIELELLEMEQEADKAALKEALLIQARQGMKRDHGTDTEKRLAEADAASLRDFISSKKETSTQRAAEVRKARVAGSPATARNARANQPNRSDQQTKLDQQAAYERYAEAQINVQLLEAQLALLQAPLNAAVQAPAAAELATSNDAAQREKAEAARKEFIRIKAKYVGYSKQLQVEQQEMQPVGMMGGMGGGMR